MTDQRVKRLIDPRGQGFMVLQGILAHEQRGEARPMSLADLATTVCVPIDELRALVEEMGAVGLVAYENDQVSARLGRWWIEDLDDEQHVGIGAHLTLPMVGVTRHHGGRSVTVNLEFNENTMWLLIEALSIAVESSTPADQERFLAAKTVLQRHQDALLLVADADGADGRHDIRDEELGPWFELPRATSGRC